MKHRLHTSKYERDRDRRTKEAAKQLEREKRAKYKNAAVSENFLKIKRKFTVAAIVKSVVCGASLGVFVVGLLLLVFKLQGIPFKAVYYIITGVGSALLCGGITFLFFRPGNKKIAKSVDEEYGLKEQVQTSLAFSRETGGVVELQRERAESAIGSLPAHRVKFSRIWQYFVIAALAVALAVAAILVPAKKVEGGTGMEEPTIPVTQYQYGRIEEIINNIKGSPLANDSVNGKPELAQAVVEELEEFHEKLLQLDADGEEIPLNEVLAAINTVNKMITDETSYQKIASSVSAKAAANSAFEDKFSPVILKGGNAYRTYNIIANYSAVETYYENKGAEVTNKIAPLQTALRQWLVPQEDTVLDDGVDPEASGDESRAAEDEGETADDPIELANAIDKITWLSTVLVMDRSIPDGNLKQYVTELSDKLTLIIVPADVTLDSIRSEAGEVLEEFFTNSVVELANQSYYLAMDRYIGNAIRDIFNIDLVMPDVEETNNQSSGGGTAGGSQGGESGIGGGGGSGDRQFASDDEIYDYRDGKNKQYGEVLDEYYADMRDMLADSETLTEEQKKMIEAYFNALSNGNGN